MMLPAETRDSGMTVEINVGNPHVDIVSSQKQFFERHLTRNKAWIIHLPGKPGGSWFSIKEQIDV